MRCLVLFNEQEADAVEFLKLLDEFTLARDVLPMFLLCLLMGYLSWLRGGPFRSKAYHLVELVSPIDTRRHPQLTSALTQ